MTTTAGAAAPAAPPDFGALLRGYRLTEGLSQGELALRIRGLAPVPGVTDVAVAHWEAGRRVPRPMHLALICRVFKLEAPAVYILVLSAAQGNRNVMAFLRSFEATRGEELGQSALAQAKREEELVKAFYYYASTDFSAGRTEL